MKGLELSRRYFEAFGRPMLERDFPELLPLIAAGLVGSGSERFGYDDEVSRDHDFEPGFCIFLPDETVVDRRAAFRLERAYAKLPETFEGVSRQRLSPVGGSRSGVIRIADFYGAAVGAPDGQLPAEAWLKLPSSALAEATNGEVFFDGYGLFTRIREGLLAMPEDIRRKRLAGQLLLMAQAGQYNFARCLAHGEPEAAQLACHDFVTAALQAVFLLRRRYLPYYKWSFRALRALPDGYRLSNLLAPLLSGDNTDPAVADEKQGCIETVAGCVIALLQEQNLTDAVCGDLEKHAYSVNDHVTDGAIRNLHILASV